MKYIIGNKRNTLVDMKIFKEKMKNNEELMLLGTYDNIVVMARETSYSLFKENNDRGFKPYRVLVEGRGKENGSIGVLDDGTLGIWFLYSIENALHKNFDHLDFVFNSLKKLNIEGLQKVNNDILLNGKKILGVGTQSFATEYGVKKLASMMLCFEMNFEVANDVAYIKNGKEFQERVLGIKQQIPEFEMGPMDFANYLLTEFEKFYGEKLEEDTYNYTFEETPEDVDFIKNGSELERQEAIDYFLKN